jgi:FKBP-type peptidyl-prolyl cis-trans isomerase SlpA
LGDRLTLHYRLSCAGQEVASTFGADPETFVVGAGEIDPRLEVHLLGLPVGTHTTLTLGPGEAFGARDEALVHQLPRTDFDPALDLAVGHTVDFSLPNGQTLSGTILALNETHVLVDFNHPLAGLPVEFEVEVLAINA